MTAPALHRRLGLPLLTLYGVGVMVGAGAYVLIGAVAGQAGDLAPLAFLLAGLIAAPTAATYAELSSRIPEAGGEAAWLRDAFGIRALNRLAGFAIIGGATISGAAVLQGGVGYLQALVPGPAWLWILALGAALAAAAVAGVVESLALAAALTVIEVAGLLLVIAAGLTAPEAAPAPAVETAMGPAGIAGLGAGALLAFFAFIGFEDMVNMAEEAKNPQRDMPRAIFLALGTVTLLYIAVSWAAARAVPAEALAASPRPLALVTEAGMPAAVPLLALIAFFAALNGVLAQMVMCARMLFGLGRDGSALAIFHRAHPRFGTPVLATLSAAAVMIAIALFVPLLHLAETSASILLCAFCAVNVALIVIKRRGPAAPGVFTVPGWVPWLGLAASVAALLAGRL